MTLQEKVFAVSPAIRYVAIYENRQLHLHQRPALSSASSSESDRYEELLVNPTLLKLVQQRGDIDCGGLDYVLIRYGNFFQWVCPRGAGHISVAIEATVDPMPIVVRLKELAVPA